MSTSKDGTKDGGTVEHDQDRDPPRTAVPPDSPGKPAQPSASKDDPQHDQDSDPPRTSAIR
jgi:hypothetical protein